MNYIFPKYMVDIMIMYEVALGHIYLFCNFMIGLLHRTNYCGPSVGILLLFSCRDVLCIRYSLFKGMVEHT